VTGEVRSATELQAAPAAEAAVAEYYQTKLPETLGCCLLMLMVMVMLMLMLMQMQMHSTQPGNAT
jgi:hypothetical protein